MISLQEKKVSAISAAVKNSIRSNTAVNDSIASYANRDFAGAVAMHADDAAVSGVRPLLRTPRAR